MINADFHVHTNFCDGKNTPEEMVLCAISLNLSKIGLVCHAYTPCDQSYCIKKEDITPFVLEVNRLKEKYKDKIEVFCGVEYDCFAKMPIDNFDYCIGSLHYVFKDNKYLPVDESKDSVKKIVEEHFDGDFYSFCQKYYETLSDIYSKVTPNFIAHFDLVSKYNKLGDLFDENDQRYIKSWQECADKLLAKNAVFEINLGGIIRGYKDNAYPSESQIKYLLEHGAKFIINTDSHSVNALTYGNKLNIEKIFEIIS